MKFIFLTQKFHDAYKNCTEIEKKTNRPYIQIVIEVNGTLFAIPLRSNIKHNHAFFTDKANRCGADYSKTVVITDPAYIGSKKPHIRENEFKELRKSEYEIKKGLKKYINNYKKASSNLNIDRNRMLCQYSTLQYFEEYL